MCHREAAELLPLQGICSAIPDDPAAIGQLDPDTALSRGTWSAALAAVGACCYAIDCVMTGKVPYDAHVALGMRQVQREG